MKNEIPNDINGLLEHDRSEQGKKVFRGTCREYLDIVRANPGIVRLAHATVYDHVIMAAGVTTVDVEKDPRLRRLYSAETLRELNFFKDKFFGIRDTVDAIGRYFQGAKNRGEESRQILYFVGPVGSGKTSLVEELKKGMESAPPVYAVKDCPQQDAPLLLIPKHLRKKMEGLLGVRIEGDICPVCRYRLTETDKIERLTKDCFANEKCLIDNDKKKGVDWPAFWKMYHQEFDYRDEAGNVLWEKYPVEMVSFSIRARRGIASVPPTDPNNQDTSVIFGDIDISKIDRYPEDHPLVLRLNGACNRGNRGIVEFIEIFKNPPEFLHPVITATQEKAIPSPGKTAMIYFDGVIIAHSNEPDYNKFISDNSNVAIQNRVYPIRVPYAIEISEETAIYEKYLKSTDFKGSVAPHTLEVAAMFSVLTRLKPSQKCDLLTKLYLYDGRAVIEKGQAKRIDISELKEEATNEGMSGISTRTIFKAIDYAISMSDHDCINPLTIREAIMEMLKKEHLADDMRMRYVEEILRGIVHKEYLKILEKEITRAYVHAYEDRAETFFQNYWDNVAAWCLHKKVKDRATKEERDPDIASMSAVEGQLGLSGGATEGFRHDFIAYAQEVLRGGGKLSYKSYEPLKEAIEGVLTASLRKEARIITGATARDDEQGKRYDAMIERMRTIGYHPHCSEVILRYAYNNVWKD
ncbi:MAG: serine protein kinase [bacterium]|nr:serine protein kinase [bacterium]